MLMFLRVYPSAQIPSAPERESPAAPWSELQSMNICGAAHLFLSYCGLCFISVDIVVRHRKLGSHHEHESRFTEHASTFPPPQYRAALRGRLLPALSAHGKDGESALPGDAVPRQGGLGLVRTRVEDQAARPACGSSFPGQPRAQPRAVLCFDPGCPGRVECLGTARGAAGS